jgi:hypothetical protein
VRPIFNPISTDEPTSVESEDAAVEHPPRAPAAKAKNNNQRIFVHRFMGSPRFGVLRDRRHPDERGHAYLVDDARFTPVHESPEGFAESSPTIDDFPAARASTPFRVVGRFPEGGVRFLETERRRSGASVCASAR